jgi:hypothetical protein
LRSHFFPKQAGTQIDDINAQAFILGKVSHAATALDPREAPRFGDEKIDHLTDQLRMVALFSRLPKL